MLSSFFQSFFPISTHEWNRFSPSVQNSISINTFRSRFRTPRVPNTSYNRLNNGNQGRWLARLRMELSALNSHRYKYHFIPSPICHCCGTHSETNHHFFFKCPTHQLARTRLSFRLELELELTVDNEDKLLETILFGKFINPNNYSKLLDIVFQYISSTGRFA